MPLGFGAEGFAFLTPYATLHTLAQCWAEGIYVSPLAHRFWKLSLQLISRYLNWQAALSEEADWELWLQLWLDGARFVSVFKQLFAEAVKPKLAALGESVSAYSAIESNLEKLGAQNEGNAQALVSQLENGANEKLRGIDSVPLTYRHTNQPVTHPQRIADV